MQTTRFIVEPSIFIRHTPNRSFIGPGTIVLENGDILMAAPWGRPPTNFEQLAAQFPVPMLYRSRDGGRTWQEQGRINMEWKLTGMMSDGGITFLRLQDGRLALLTHRHVHGLKGGGVPVFSTSKDDGATWTPARLLVHEDSIHYVMNDRMIQLRSGRLIVPTCHPDGIYEGEGDAVVSRCFISDDLGESWRLSSDAGIARLPGDQRGLQEPCVAELADGRLLMLARTGSGSNHASWSNDGGETWSKPEPTTQTAACSSLQLKTLPDGRLIVLYNHVAPIAAGAFFPRTPLCYSVSADGGQTWGEPVIVDAEGAEKIVRQNIYPSISFTGEGIVAVWSTHGADPAGSFAGQYDANIGGGKRAILAYPGAQKMNLTTRREYEETTLSNRAERMRWWKEARFGMFVHFGLYSLLGRHEWAMATECIPKEEYGQLTEKFQPRPGAAREWAKLAKRAGMKHMVFTTKHHEGYCLWDTRQTDFNSVRTGPKRDLVAEYVSACREEGLKVGLYYSLMDWHHPDGGACHYDPDARRRFLEFTRGCVRELMSNYGPIDILWYDIPKPLDNPEGWESDAMNQMVRSLQPGILINDRSQLPEDFSTPEGEVKPAKVERERGWEACMTFNDSSWGYMTGVEVDAWSARDIVKMLGKATSQQGNLLLNIGPLPDGSVPPDAVEPLETVGRWLGRHGEAVYGAIDSFSGFPTFCGPVSRKANVLYFWRQIWSGTEQGLGGYETKLESVTCVTTGEPVRFNQEGYRIRLLDLPEKSPDSEVGVTVFKLEFEADPVFKWLPTTPAVVAGW